MSEEELVRVASVRLAPGTRVLVPDGSGGLRCGSIYQLARMWSNGVWGVGVMVFYQGSLFPEGYELSWALEHMQVIA